jgi:hypothetical protein
VLAISSVVALGAAGISTWTGFGSATVLTPILAVFLDLRPTILVVAVFHGLANAMKAIAFRREIDWRVCLMFGPTAILFAVAGGLLSTSLSVPLLHIVLGALLVFDAVSGLTGSGVRFWSRTPGTAALGGACSGLAAGVIGTGGAVRTLFLHHFVAGKERYVATSAAIAFLVDASRVPVYVTQYKDVDLWGVLPLMICTVVAGFAGVMLARRFLDRIEVDQFRRILLISLCLSGVWFLVEGVRAVGE